MTSKRLYFIFIGLICLCLVAALAGTSLINSMLVKQSQSLVKAKAQVTSLNQQEVELAKAKKDIQQYNSLYLISRSIVPQNKDQTQAVRQIVNLASNSGISLASITFPTSTLGGAAGASASSGSSSASAPSSSVATATPQSSSGSPNLSQLQKVPNIPNVYELTLAVTSNPGATFPQLISFLSALEQNRLTALVSNISITPLPNQTTRETQFTFTLKLNIYIKPGASQ